MYFRNYDEEAKLLGYKDKEEMFLYYDVCGLDSVPAKTIADLLLSTEQETLGRTKEEFIEYREENNLVDLFNKVKNLPLLERLIELYNYSYNGHLLANSTMNFLKVKLNDSYEMSDGEKQIEYEERLKNVYYILQNYKLRMDDVQRSAALRLDYNDRDTFFEYVESLINQEEEINNNKGYH